MKQLNSTALMNCTGGGPAGDHANVNAPGGTNVLFLFGTDGIAHCLNGRVVNVIPAGTPIANGIFTLNPTRTLAEALASGDPTIQQYCL